jgi:predicted acylesterase/phospholipase RssA/CRP-like cAMP-binding protein
VTGVIAELRTMRLLAGVGDDLLERIAAVVTTETVGRGETVVTEGSVGADLYFVREGSFAAIVLDGDTPTEVGRLGPGDVIGETQLVAGGQRTATVRALENSVVLHLPHEEFDALVAGSERLREAVARVIRRRVRQTALRVALPRAVGSNSELLELLSDHAAWVRVDRGEVLYEQGAPSDGWFVLVSGELSVVVSNHGVHREIGTVRRGEAFGEIALIRGAPRTATITARRDSWLARFEARILHEEVLTRTEALQTLVRTLADRLTANAHSTASSGRVLALVPRDPSIDTERFARRLAESLGANGLIVDAAMLRREGVIGDAHGLPAEHPGWLRFEAWVESRRENTSYLLFVTDGKNDPWTRAAVEQADTVLLLVDADGNPARSDVERAVLDRSRASQALPVWLVLEHPADRDFPRCTARWLDARTVEHHAHVRRDHERDIARLARWLMGRTTGLALSGGGARGFVHLGVVDALREIGREIDLITGTSAGAMAGGLLARDESPDSLAAKAAAALQLHGNPFVDFDLPVISLLRSRRLRNGLRHALGDMTIEDSWIPLRIVATDLTEARRIVFDRGPAWQRVFEASSPPGVMPPVKDGERLLCDGGLVDNLPVSVLVEEGCRVKIASYVGSTSSLPAPQAGFPSSWALLLDRILRRRRHEDVPTLLTTLLRCVSVPAAVQLEGARLAADVFFQPDLSAFSMTDFSAAPAMREAGRTHAREVLAAWPGLDE